MTDQNAATENPASADQPSAPSPAPTPGAPSPSSAPKPGAPKPGAPKPGAPKPGAHPAPHPSAAPTSDPRAFGRVDADGGVWLRTKDGERQVGSWQAGEPAEGLAHFGRRFDDLATEVILLEKRLESGTGDPKHTQHAVRQLLDTLPTAAVVGDVDSLGARLEALLSVSDELAAEDRRHRQAARAEHAARKEVLAVEAESIGAESTQWKSGGDRLREILEEWKTIRGLDRKTDDALWKRYSKAREAFNRRRGAHFAELDRDRAGARTRKEELVAQAEELATATDWGPTTGRFRELMAEWKAAGRAPRDAEDTLWESFKAAQDVFFAARNAASSERDAELTENAEAKRALLGSAEKLDPTKDLEGARNALRALQEQWDEIGKVPREMMQDLEGRMRAVEQKVREASDSRWQRTDPEAQARAAQFRERATQFEEQAAKARTAGKEKRAQEAEAQAAQWREWAQTAEQALR
ncbi:MAG: DUF349 domain-containing protein [Mycobacteriaceae bacterium]